MTQVFSIPVIIDKKDRLVCNQEAGSMIHAMILFRRSSNDLWEVDMETLQKELSEKELAIWKKQMEKEQLEQTVHNLCKLKKRIVDSPLNAAACRRELHPVNEKISGYKKKIALLESEIWG